MPFMSGQDLFEQILSCIPDVNILFTSGYLPNTLPNSITRVINDYRFLPKPYAMNELSRSIDEIIHKRGTSK